MVLTVMAVIGAAAVGAVMLRADAWPTSDPPAPPPTPRHRLIFAEEFDGDLDPEIWRTCHWWADEWDGCTITSNDELQWYLPDGASVDDGALRLTATERPVESPEGGTFPYRSGMVSTGPDGYEDEREATFAFTYGVVEARIRVPAGTGLWPAVWMLPVDRESRPEIDLVEVLGDTTAVARVHYHYSDQNGDAVAPGESITGPDLSEGWHTVAVDWRPGAITWFVDDREVWSYVGDEVSSEPMYLVANLAVGGEYPGPPTDDTAFPAEFAIDRIRVWQRGSA